MASNYKKILAKKYSSKSSDLKSSFSGADEDELTLLQQPSDDDSKLTLEEAKNSASPAKQDATSTKVISSPLRVPLPLDTLVDELKERISDTKSNKLNTNELISSTESPLSSSPNYVSSEGEENSIKPDTDFKLTRSSSKLKTNVLMPSVEFPPYNSQNYNSSSSEDSSKSDPNFKSPTRKLRKNRKKRSPRRKYCTRNSSPSIS